MGLIIGNFEFFQFAEYYAPVYNKDAFVFKSINNGQPNFKYIADVYVNGERIRLTQYPHPTYRTAAFNFNTVVKNYISQQLINQTGFTRQIGGGIQYYAYVGEEYGLASSGTTVYPNQVILTPYYVWDGALKHLEYLNYSVNNYLAAGTAIPAANALNLMPSSGVIYENENAWSTVLAQSSGGVYFAEIDTYDSAGSLIQTVKYQNPHQAVSSINDRYLNFPSGTKNLNELASSGVVSGSLPIITDSVDKYSIRFTRFNGVQSVNKRWFTYRKLCTKNVKYRFHFKNHIGGWDSFSFIRASRKRADITRSTYKKTFGNMINSESWGYQASDNIQADYNINYKESIRVQSDWIDEETNAALFDMVSSTQVYVDDDTYGLIPVTIVSNSYDFKQEATDKLFNLEIEFRYTFENYIQQR